MVGRVRGFELVGRLKHRIKARNDTDWEEEVYMKSILKWYKLAIVQG